MLFDQIGSPCKCVLQTNILNVRCSVFCSVTSSHVKQVNCRNNIFYFRVCSFPRIARRNYVFGFLHESDTPLRVSNTEELIIQQYYMDTRQTRFIIIIIIFYPNAAFARVNNRCRFIPFVSCLQNSTRSSYTRTGIESGFQSNTLPPNLTFRISWIFMSPIIPSHCQTSISA